MGLDPIIFVGRSGLTHIEWEFFHHKLRRCILLSTGTICRWQNLFYVQMWHLLYKINWLNISELQDVGMWNLMILLLLDMILCQRLIGLFIPLELKGLYYFTILGTSYLLLQHISQKNGVPPTPLWEPKNSCGTCAQVMQSTQIQIIRSFFILFCMFQSYILTIIR